MAETPRFRVNQISYIGFALAQPGEEISMEQHDDKHFVGENLTPLNAEAKAWVNSQTEPHPDKVKVKRAKAAPAGDEGKDQGEGGEGEKDLT